VQREQRRVDVVRQALAEPVERVERVARVRRGHDPPVVRLVQVPVDARVVQAAMDPVDAEVGEGDEQRALQIRVPPPPSRTGGLVAPGRVVQPGVAAHLGDEDGRGERGHDGQRGQRLPDLLADLVAQELGVLHLGLVEDEEERGSGADEVEEDAEDPVMVSIQ